jgi:hypothetical protein
MDDIDLTHFMDEMTIIINLMENIKYAGNIEEPYIKMLRLRDQMATIRNKMQHDQIYNKMERARGNH